MISAPSSFQNDYFFPINVQICLGLCLRQRPCLSIFCRRNRQYLESIPGTRVEMPRGFVHSVCSKMLYLFRMISYRCKLMDFCAILYQLAGKTFRHFHGVSCF